MMPMAWFRAWRSLPTEDVSDMSLFKTTRAAYAARRRYRAQGYRVRVRKVRR
jgi:hypothetical protein